MQTISFISLLLLFLFHQLLQIGIHISIPFFDNYLDPFCLGALSMHLYLFERNWLYDYKKISILSSFIIFLFLSIVSEVLFPYLSNRFTADWHDVIAIFLGITFYHITRLLDNKFTSDSANKYPYK